MLSQTTSWEQFPLFRLSLMTWVSTLRLRRAEGESVKA
jgi:hypothetical protein